MVASELDSIALNRPLFWVHNDTVSLDVCVCMCVYILKYFFIWLHQALDESYSGSYLGT